MAAGRAGADFKLVLDGVSEARREEVAAELKEVLLLDARTANEALSNVPIVLIAGMNQQQAANLRTHLTRLVKLGAKLRLTAEPVGRLKQLRWQALPPVVRRPGNIFVCPSCGERFIVQRWTPAPVARQAAAPGPPAEPVEAVPVAEAAGEVPEAEPVVEAEPAAVAEGAFEELDAAAAADVLTLEEERSTAERAGARPTAAGPPGGPRYDVSVAKLRADKLEQLAGLLVERGGISYEEATSRCERTVVVVCRNAPSSEADDWRRALLRIGIKPRIRKRPG